MENKFSKFINLQGKYLTSLLFILLLGIGQMWAAYYTPTADEVIVLPDIYNSSKTDAGYSDHSAITWGAAGTTNSKKAGDPDNSGAATSANKTCYSVKNNGAGKRITLSISGCSGLIIYRQTDNLTRYVNLLATPDGESQTTISGSVCASPYFAHDYTLDGSKSYTIVLQGTQTGSDQQDVYVYAIKLIKATGGGGGDDPVAVTGISIAPSPAAVKVGKTVALAATVSPDNATDKSVTWSVKSGSTYASVVEATGVVTGLAEGTAVITATANDGSGVSKDVTVNVSACPTSGTIFSMDITASEGTAYTGNNTFPTLIDATYVGGAAYSGSKSGTNRTSTIDANGEYPFSANSELAIKVVMDCDLAEGDIINITTSSTRQIKIQKVVGTDLHKTADKTFTIPSGSSLIGENVFYLMRDNSESTLKSFTVIRPLYRTITLEYADGATADGSIEVIDGTAATKPADPTWAHHRFDGWYNGASPYDWTATVSGDLTLTAHWTQLYTVTYAAGDGTATGDAPTQVDKAEGETFEVAANTFAVASKDFDKWNDGTTDYAPGDTYTVGTENVVLTAQWKAAVDKYTVIFKDGETTLDTKLVEVGSYPSDAGIDKTKPLFAFAAWQLSGSDIALDDASWASVAANAEVTLTARWAKAYASNIDFEAFIDAEGTSGDWGAELAAKNYAISSITSVTLDAPSGKPADKGLKIKNSGTYISFNVNAGKLVILKTGVLSGAEISKDGGTNYTALTSASGSTGTSVISYHYNAAEAEYRIRTTTNSYNIIQAITIQDPYTVSFDVNGGDAAIADMSGTPSVTLPSATKGTDSFVGWFDALDNKIGDAGDIYTPTANIELVAHWEAVSTDARLSAITFSSNAGTLSPAFDPEVVNYTYTMPYGTAAVPTITGATAVHAKAKEPVIVQQASAWNETAIIRGVAESDDTKAYNITMKIAPKDGTCIVKAELAAGSSAASISATSGAYKDEANIAINVAKDLKLGGTGNYVKVAVKDTYFQDGDIVEIVLRADKDAPAWLQIFADEGTTMVAEMTSGVTKANPNYLTISGVPANTSALYLYRTGAAAGNMNPYPTSMAVYRPMNPVLTAITIDGRDGEIDALDDKHFSVTIPYEAVLSSLTVVPTIIRNAAHATTPEAVISNEGAWILGDNTYRIMDKDGDYTDYTITLDRDVLKHTVSFNVHGGSAVDAQLVVDGENPVAPSEPTKDDYIFQGWAETEDGAIVDVTTFAITADKVFHAVWASDGGIKLLSGSTVNHTNFITGVTADETVEFKGNTVNYAKFSGTVSNVNGVKDLTRVIAYNATTNKTKIQISAHNNSTSGRNILVKGLVEGADAAVDLATIALGNKEDKISEWIEFNNAANRTIYIMVSSSAGDVYFTQVKVIESGETPMKQAGEVGYSLNFNKGRFFGVKDLTAHFEGLEVEVRSSDCQALNTSVVKLASSSISFDVVAPVTLTVTTNNSNTYYVTEGAAGTDNETAYKGASEFNLTVGTWYITAGTSNVEVTNIAFSAPKCEKPAFTSLANVDLCEGDPFTAINGAATVSDGGTISYQWYNEDESEISGAIAASFTPSADGKYYVIATNSLAGFADNFAKSDLVTVQHVASAVITEAPKSVRKDAGEEATLTVVASGKNLSYEWFTCNEDGTGAVAIVPAETNASLTVTVPSGTQWYKVVVSSDCGNAEAIAKVEEWVALSQVDVTATTEWDWANAGGVKIAPEKNVEILMANIKDGDNVMPNDANFNSQALLFSGQESCVSEGGRWFAKGNYIKFNTTVPGAVFVQFSDNGSNNRRVRINGKLSDASASKTDIKTFMVNVPAGEVELMGVSEDGATENQYIRFHKITFVKTDYTREVNSGRYGTICLPNGGKMYGASLYEVAYKDASKIYFDEILNGEMEAGVPYIFLPDNGIDLIAVAYTDEANASAGNRNGLYGSYTQEELPTDGSYYVLLNNQYCQVVNVHTYVGANRAYIKLDDITTHAVAPAPGRRRISMGYSGENTATGIDEITNDQSPITNKVLIDGQLFILRGEQMFDATGRLVK